MSRVHVRGWQTGGRGVNTRRRRGTARSGDAAPASGALARRIGAGKARHARRSLLYRVGFAAAGFAVLGAGLAMLVLPGPGLLVTAVGLGMLALEFAWAERLLLRGAQLGDAGRVRLTRRPLRRSGAEETDA